MMNWMRSILGIGTALAMAGAAGADVRVTLRANALVGGADGNARAVTVADVAEIDPPTTDEAMRIACVRLAIDAVARIDEPYAGGGGRNALSDVFVSFRRAEFGGEILLARHSLERDPVVEKIRPEMHLYRNIGRHGDRLFQPLLADEAPGADHVGHDVDADRL